MSEAEVPRILGQVPLETDKANVWEMKANALERITRGLNKRISLLNSGVPAAILDQLSVEDLADYPERLERTPGMRQRDAGGSAPSTQGFTITRH